MKSISALGRLLPREVRERVFEPSYYDLLREHIETDANERKRSSLLLGALKIFLGSVGCGLVRIALSRKAIKRLFIGVTVLTAIVSLFLLRDWLGQMMGY